MSKLKRLAVSVVAVLMLASLLFTACGQPAAYNTVMSIDGMEIPAGLYLAYQFNAYGTALGMSTDDNKSILKQEIEGKTGTQWIYDKTMEYLKTHVAVEKEFESLNLSFTDEELEENKATADQAWADDQALYLKNGTGKENYTKVFDNMAKALKIFYHHYGEGGDKEVPVDEIKDYYKANYAKVAMAQFLKVKASGSAFDTQELEELKTWVTDATNTLKAGGADFEQVVRELTKKDYEVSGHEYSDDEEYIKETLIPKETEDYYKTMLTTLFDETEVGEYQQSEASQVHMIYRKLDLFEKPEEFEEAREGLLRLMKYEEQTETFKENSEKLSAEVNEKAVKYFSPKKIKVS